MREIRHQSDRGESPTTMTNQRDLYIGELPTYTDFSLEPTDQRFFRECHHHPYLTTVADMTNAAGTELLPGIWELRSTQHGNVLQNLLLTCKGDLLQHDQTQYSYRITTLHQQ